MANIMAISRWLSPNSLLNRKALARRRRQWQVDAEAECPLPGSESRQTRPFMRSTAFFTMARPMPVPGYSLSRCMRWNMRKIFSCASLGMPMPLSSMQMRTN